MQIKIVLRTIRPSFLVLTPVCVFLGLSISLTKQPQVDWFSFLLIMVGAMLAHISVNTLNEYFDFKSGLDLQTHKTAFSGGSGALPEEPQEENSVLIAGIASAILTIFIGIYFISKLGFQLLPIGLAGMALIVMYTQWINRLPILCLISPGIGFGILMVTGTFLVLTESYSGLPWLIPLVPFFLINNLLLLNQYPDMKADTSAGRNTFPIAFGILSSNSVYALFLLLGYSIIALESFNGHIPTLGFIALLPVALSGFSLFGAIKHKARIADHPQYLGANVAASILTPLLLGLSIIKG